MSLKSSSDHTPQNETKKVVLESHLFLPLTKQKKENKINNKNINDGQTQYLQKNFQIVNNASDKTYLKY